MNVPKIQTAEGKKPVTIVPNNLLVEGFLNSDASAEDKDLVNLMRFSELSPKKVASILRECLTKSRDLVAVYPGLGQTPPAKSTYVCGIMEGSIYIV